jgi:3-hydroxy-D-aspartate aldolase
MMQSKLAAQAASEFGVEFGAFVEIDLGMWRCDVAPGQPAAELAERIAAAPGLKFLGLQAYEGRAQHLKMYAERKNANRSSSSKCPADHRCNRSARP